MELDLTDMQVFSFWYWISQKCNNSWSRHEFINKDSSTKIDNKKNILILEKGPTQGLEHTLNAEKMHSINFTEKKFFFLVEPTL